jgi:hypothetical protein
MLGHRLQLLNAMTDSDYIATFFGWSSVGLIDPNSVSSILYWYQLLVLLDNICIAVAMLQADHHYSSYFRIAALKAEALLLLLLLLYVLVPTVSI